MISMRSCDSLRRISYGVIPGLALRDFGEIDLDAGAAAAGRFAGRTGEPGRAHVLDAGDGIGGEQFQTRFEQQLFFEWIADLDGGPVFARFFGQIARGERGPGQTIATGFRADIKHGVADAAGRAARELLMPQDAEAKDIDQRIAFETFVEIDLAADGRDADAIAVMRNAGDDAGEEPAVGLDDLALLLPVIGPKRSELSRNSGRAPMVKMSRMIPPTPVAAPWNGSIALG